MSTVIRAWDPVRGGSAVLGVLLWLQAAPLLLALSAVAGLYAFPLAVASSLLLGLYAAWDEPDRLAAIWSGVGTALVPLGFMLGWRGLWLLPPAIALVWSLQVELRVSPKGLAVHARGLGLTWPWARIHLPLHPGPRVFRFEDPYEGGGERVWITDLAAGVELQVGAGWELERVEAALRRALAEAHSAEVWGNKAASSR
ncbi:MAG: hypothetical protein H6740_21505 [Alphaproteobacteria bacterium]|nr:hypothetical protein [Alphaproteobacteria bacterium]